MKFFSSKRRLVVAAAVVLLLLFLLRPGASRLKSRIAGSLSAAVARPVEIGNVHIRLLPRPGFDLENLVVYDDAAFGAEPMLRAGEVTAILRLTSLARGRLEIARLDLTEPSLNLVRGANGRWNLEALLERAAQTPLLPTGSARSGPRPGFPYIEASSGRINFKQGAEKRPYALTNADFSLWQDSENAWGVRLKAQPFRSDMNLSDTGILRVNGTWQRAASLRETPLQFSLEWDRPQLGQLTKFFTGSDKGWRGAVLLDITLAGTPAKLQMSTDASIRDFRRYDVSTGDALRLAAHCDAQYSSIDHGFHELFCRAPVGGGSLTVHGSMGLPGSHQYDIAVVAESLPASAVVALAQRTKKNLPQDLTATGSVQGSFSFQANGASDNAAQAEGQGQVSSLRLSSPQNKTEFALGDVPFVLSSTERKKMPGRNVPLNRGLPLASVPHLEFGPFPMAAGRTATTVRGWLDRSGYVISLAGEMEVEQALEAARLVGVPALTANVTGAAQVSLEVAGSWWERLSGPALEFSQPQVTGSAKLRNVRAELRGVDGPVEISSADLQLLSDEVRVTKLTAAAAHTVWTGSLQLPRGCGTPGACLVRVNLNANEVALGEMSRWLNPGPRNQPWYRALTSTPQTGSSFFANLHASGKVTANRLLLRGVAATHVSANASLTDGKLRLSDLRGNIFGGEHRGEWAADFSVKPPTYTGNGAFTAISLARIADAMQDRWVAGTASGSYKLTASGSSTPEFWHSADAAIQCEMHDGIFPHISVVGGSVPLRVDRFEGRARLREGQIEIKDAQLDSSSGVFAVGGTASFERNLDLKLMRSPMVRLHGFTITGTVAEPQVVQMSSPETQARLKRQ